MDKKNKQTKSNKDKDKDKDKQEKVLTRPRLLKGKVASDKMDKTIVVLVDRYKEHPKYKKRYKVSKRYKAHDAKNEFKSGDKVVIKETKPISKDKKWIVVDGK